MVGFDRLCDFVDTALCRKLTTADGIRAAIGRATRKGLALLDQVLSVWTPGPLPGSPAEMRLVRHLVRWGLPLPERQHRIFDENGIFVARVDVAVPAWRFGFEYEGEEFHLPRRWTHDDERQARLEALGWRIERVDRFDLRPSSTRLRDLVAELLGSVAA